MEPSDSCTIRVKKTSRDTINEFCNRTQTNVIDFIEQLTDALQKQLDLMSPDKRLLYMVDFYNRDNHPKTIIRLSDALMSSFEEIPPPVQKEVLKAFDYGDNFEDLRSKKPTERKEQIPQPPEEFFDNGK